MDSNQLSTYVPVYDYIPENWQQAREALIQYLRLISNGVNYRDVGTYYNQEVLAGQRFVPLTNQSEPRAVFRKVIKFGAMPNAIPKSVAHGITITSNTRFTRIYGTANQPSTKFLPLPFVSSAAVAQNIELFVDATNVTVITGTNYSAYTDSFVVVEFVQEG